MVLAKARLTPKNHYRKKYTEKNNFEDSGAEK